MSPFARLPLLLLGGVALVLGVLAGLVRLAAPLPVPELVAAQAGVHGALMIPAFLGTVISLERAVALGRRWAYLAPLSAGLSGLALVAAMPMWVVHLLMILAAAVLSTGSLWLFLRQPAQYLATLALGALCWLVGNLSWWLTGLMTLAVPWWMAFLVLTIAGERLELTRFLPMSTTRRHVFMAIVVGCLLGLVGAFWSAAVSLRLFGAGLLALALWLLRCDIARRTVKQAGLTRFVASCLLAGYVWLMLGGVLALAGGLDVAQAGTPLRDAALHTVFLGFVFSMIFGHAPIILPAVARIRIGYHPFFYIPLLVLHASLLLRVLGDALFDALPQLRGWAALGNGLALALFVGTMLTAAVRSRVYSTQGVSHANP